jgi:hypothetical protein
MVTNMTGFCPEDFVSRFAEKVKQAKISVSKQQAPSDVMAHADDPFATSNSMFSLKLSFIYIYL